MNVSFFFLSQIRSKLEELVGRSVNLETPVPAVSQIDSILKTHMTSGRETEFVLEQLDSFEKHVKMKRTDKDVSDGSQHYDSIYLFSVSKSIDLFLKHQEGFEFILFFLFV